MEFWGSSYQARLWTPADDLPDLWFRASDINQSSTASWSEYQGRLTLTRQSSGVSFTTFGSQTAVSLGGNTFYTGTYSVANLSQLTIIAFGSRPQATGTGLDPLVAWQTNGQYATDILFFISKNATDINTQVNSGADGGATASLPSVAAAGMFFTKYNGAEPANNDKIKISYNESALTVTPDYTIPTSIPSGMSTVFRVGGYDGNIFFKGSFSDIMIYRRAISIDLQQKLAGWSSWTSGAWTLPSSHPYILNPPRV